MPEILSNEVLLRKRKRKKNLDEIAFKKKKKKKVLQKWPGRYSYMSPQGKHSLIRRKNLKERFLIRTSGRPNSKENSHLPEQKRRTHGHEHGIPARKVSEFGGTIFCVPVGQNISKEVKKVGQQMTGWNSPVCFCRSPSTTF